MEKEYLGDSVYVQTDRSGGLVLTTENDGDVAIGPSNIIVLEPEVVAALVPFGISC